MLLIHAETDQEEGSRYEIYQDGQRLKLYVNAQCELALAVSKNTLRAIGEHVLEDWDYSLKNVPNLRPVT